jgi:hypothetical protein
MRNTARFVREVADKQLRLWKFDTAEWPVQQVVKNACVRSWLAKLDSNCAAFLTASIFRNQLVNWFQLVKMWVTSLRSRQL